MKKYLILAISAFSVFISTAQNNNKGWELAACIDTYDSGVNYTDTTNRVTVEWVQNGSINSIYRVIKSKKGVGASSMANCDGDFVTDGGYMYDIGNPGYGKGGPFLTHLIVTIDGDDAMWIDELSTSILFDGKVEKQMSWGMDGNNGFCLSTDPKDTFNRNTGCYNSIIFNLIDGEAYPYNGGDPNNYGGKFNQ
ncbi:MAG: hypothetical protein ACI9JT_001587 [Polaribacter sp.]|jgi:hypothetical protein